MDIIKKNIGFYEQLIKYKEEWEKALENTPDIDSCIKEIKKIEKQLDFLRLAFQINGIELT